MYKIKRFKVHFMNRTDSMLNNVFEIVEATSRVKATAWGKSIATERGWFFVDATLCGGKLMRNKRRRHARI